MNTTCENEACVTTPTQTCNPTAGVTESPQKPRYTVTNRDEAFEIAVDLPGVPKSAVQVQLEDDILTVRGERHTATPEAWKTRHREISAQPFLLRLRVNTPVNDEQLTASLEDGVLKVNLPLKTPAKARKIEVQ